MRTERNLTRLDRVFARLDREPERPAHIDVPKMSRHRVVLFSATLAFYVAIVWAVVTTSWLVRLDWQVMFFRPYQQWPQIHAFLDYYVVLGQRGPTAVMVAAWLGWRSWRQHTLRPLLTLGASLLLLNITVGAAKLGMGRLGPHYATTIGANEMVLGGDIFPSGHTANAVVTWGILAYLASTPRARRWLSALSAVTSLGVGLTTVYLGTHWLSDVLLGWAAGLLILLALPWVEPVIARIETALFDLRDGWRARRGRMVPAPALEPARPGGVPAATPTAPVPVVLKPRSAPADPAPEPVASVRSPRAPIHLAPGPHTTRSERSPVTPAGSRRPPHADRVPRGPAPAARP
ncbi:phosphatase PAP2 family protein [Streptomyces sp. NPDC046805]|uniref:phosphatase PAP2 family protein n=1 Tax=Streptomyces sp. NPDC046805 TaxID=3155134 RepID=UPI00340293CB